jgi:hypothetical protein
MVPAYCIVGAGIMGVFAMFYSFVQDIHPAHTSKCLGMIGATVWLIVSTLHPLIGRFADKSDTAIGKFTPWLLAAGSLPGVMKRWEAALPARIKLSPLVTAGGIEFGGANRFIHIWAYKSMDQRLQVREQGRKAGVWPPPGGGDELLAQETKIVMPSAFSPLQ